MSKFIDKLTKLARGGSQPIGFRAKQELSAVLKMQLIARLSPENAKGLSDKLAGADAGLITVSETGQGIEILEELCVDYADILWGCWVAGASRAAIEKLTGAGGDFTVFSAADTPLDIINDDDTGRIMEVDSSIDEGLLRTANSLPVDAVLISEKGKGSSELTWQHLMLFRRFADLLTKPLLVTVPTKISAGELEALWEAGVKGIVVEVTAKTPKDALKKLRQAIDKLKTHPQRRQGKPDAILPGLVGKRETAAAEEDDEDEDEDEYED